MLGPGTSLIFRGLVRPALAWPKPATTGHINVHLSRNMGMFLVVLTLSFNLNLFPSEFIT